MESTTDIRQNWRQLLAQDHLQQLVNQLLQHSEAIGAREWNEELLVQAARLQQYHKDQRIGGVAYDNLTRTRINISQSLLSIINEMPETPADIKKQGSLKKRNKETFRKRILRYMLLAKGIVFIWLILQWHTSGLSLIESFASVLILLPVIIIYLTIGHYNITAQKANENRASRFQSIRKEMRRSAPIIFALYTFMMVYIVMLGTSGELGEKESFPKMILLLIVIESSLGWYTGKVVSKLVD